MAYYNTCEVCGCNLDPGERCDCASEKEQKIKQISQSIVIGVRGQYRLNFEKESDLSEKVAI